MSWMIGSLISEEEDFIWLFYFLTETIINEDRSQSQRGKKRYKLGRKIK
jgi:hypothetical protein